MMDATRFSGQTAIITGANSGIGEGIARRLSAEGANVVINYLFNPDAAERIAADINAQGRGKAIIHKADVASEEQVKGLFKAALDAFGFVDILVNNAGIHIKKQVEDITIDEWQKVNAVNLDGTFLCTREAIAIMRKVGRRQINGKALRSAVKIINISSVHQVIMWSYYPSYCATKAGINLFAQSVAQEVAHYKIRVNNVASGAIRTPINRSAWETSEALADLLKMIPYGRIGEVEDVAAAVSFLASEESDYITGSTLYVDGGMMLYPEFRFGG